ncbi:hypothetical protein GCM10023310_17470 [Paenibacillus vulneris]|uniref:Uncharacterized protein n=1 Tax=Paenibacillus vulneris TaxID=1133364 RepID=A0ABW3UK61_9BACL
MKKGLAQMTLGFALLFASGAGIVHAEEQGIHHEQRKISYNGSSYTLDLIRIDLKEIPQYR